MENNPRASYSNWLLIGSLYVWVVFELKSVVYEVVRLLCVSAGLKELYFVEIVNILVLMAAVYGIALLGFYVFKTQGMAWLLGFLIALKLALVGMFVGISFFQEMYLSKSLTEKIFSYEDSTQEFASRIPKRFLYLFDYLAIILGTYFARWRFRKPESTI